MTRVRCWGGSRLVVDGVELCPVDGVWSGGRAPQWFVSDANGRPVPPAEASLHALPGWTSRVLGGSWCVVAVVAASVVLFGSVVARPLLSSLVIQMAVVVALLQVSLLGRRAFPQSTSEAGSP